MTTEERLEKVERELAAVYALGVGAVPKTIRAKEFILEDENGKRRAGLRVLKDGPGLYLYDEDGK